MAGASAHTATLEQQKTPQNPLPRSRALAPRLLRDARAAASSSDGGGGWMMWKKITLPLQQSIWKQSRCNTRCSEGGCQENRTRLQCRRCARQQQERVRHHCQTQDESQNGNAQARQRKNANPADERTHSIDVIHSPRRTRESKKAPRLSYTRAPFLQSTTGLQRLLHCTQTLYVSRA